MTPLTMREMRSLALDVFDARTALIKVARCDGVAPAIALLGSVLERLDLAIEGEWSEEEARALESDLAAHQNLLGATVVAVKGSLVTFKTAVGQTVEARLQYVLAPTEPVLGAGEMLGAEGP